VVDESVFDVDVDEVYDVVVVEPYFTLGSFYIKIFKRLYLCI